MSTVYFKRQGGGKSSDLTAEAPPTLEYGEPAVDSDGVLYVGNGKGNVVSKVQEAGNGMWLYKATFAVDAWQTIVEKQSDDDSDTEVQGRSLHLNAPGGDNYYQQTADVTAVDGGPILTPSMNLSAPLAQTTDNNDTNKELLKALSIINGSSKTVQVTTVDGNDKTVITVRASKTLSCDITVYWYAR